MTNEKAKQIRRIYGIFESIVIILAGICLMVQCVAIYRSGDHPFSREVVAAHFAPIAVPVYLCLAMVVVGLILDLILPKVPEKKIAQKQYTLILGRLQAKKDLDACDEALRSAVLAQRKSRTMHKRIRNILCAICAVVFLSYGMNPGNFHQSEINFSMINAMCVLIPCLIVSFACAVLTAYHNRASIQKEIELLKKAPAAAVPAAEEPVKAANWPVILRNVIAAAAVIVLVYGFVSGGTADVLTKAVNICTECVGLG